LGALVSGPDQREPNGAAQIRVAEPVGDRDRPLDIGDRLIARLRGRQAEERVREDLDERGVVARTSGHIDGFEREVASVAPLQPEIVRFGIGGKQARTC
jgi:hypothetical protein